MTRTYSKSLIAVYPSALALASTSSPELWAVGVALDGFREAAAAANRVSAMDCSTSDDYNGNSES